MKGNRRTPLRVMLMAVIATSALAWGLGQPFQSVGAQQSNFVGGNPTPLDAKTLRTLRLRFKAGSRTNWHSHPQGQLLMAEQGRGRVQERGGPVRELVPGQPWFTKPGVAHWHGAAPDEDLVQLAVFEATGDATWFEPVSDAVYKAAPHK